MVPGFIASFITIMLGSVLPFMLLSLYNDCNEVAYTAIQSIKRIDEFQCAINLYMPGYNITFETNTRCTDISHSCLEDITKCDRVLVKFNHYYYDKACMAIIKTSKEAGVSKYENIVYLCNILLISICIFIPYICFALYTLSHRDNKKIKVA
jgi:hypothetical protein